MNPRTPTGGTPGPKGPNLPGQPFDPNLPPPGPNKRWAAAGIGLAAVLVVLTLFKINQKANEPAPLAPLPTVAPTVVVTASDKPGPPRPRTTRVDDGDAPKGDDEVQVHVAGRVAHPGVIKLAASSRVKDAIDRAGGPLEDANLEALNLADWVHDGGKIMVPSKNSDVPVDDTTGSGSYSGGHLGGKLVNLNTASERDLEDLPGVGPRMAEKILDYRLKHGNFRQIDELLNVPGIGAKKLDELRDKVTVG